MRLLVRFDLCGILHRRSGRRRTAGDGRRALRWPTVILARSPDLKFIVDKYESRRILTRMQKLPRPTEAEISIFALWRWGPSTVRQVLAELDRGTGYTTALKLMQIMTGKGLVVRDERARSHVYRAAVPEAQTLRGIAGNVLHRAFGGSTPKLLVAALSAWCASAQELDEMVAA